MPYAAPIISAAAAVASVGYGVYAGEEGKKARKKGLKQQESAQNQALAASKSQQADAAMAQKKANRKTPNIAALLAASQSAKLPSTFLTGPGGAGQSKLGL